MNKKLAALIGSVLMITMSFASPVLASATKLSEINKMVSTTGNILPLFVIGAAAQPADVASALDVAVGLAQYAKTTTTVTGTAGAGETVTGGAKIATSGIYLAPNASPQAVKAIFTASDIPDLLGTKTYTTGSGGAYQFKQYLYIAGITTNSNPARITYTRPSTENTPRIAFYFPGGSKGYDYKLTFPTPVSLSTVSTQATLDSLLQGTTINLLGKDFVISAETCSTSASAPIQDITLLGGKSLVTVQSGTPQTVTSGGKDYTVTLSGVAAQTVGSTTYYTAIGDVNGEAFQLKAGDSTVLSDGTKIAAIKVFQGKTGAADFATIAVGADQIKLASAGTVTRGTTTVPELTATITQSATSLSAIQIAYTPQSDIYMNVGDSLTDPFASAFSIKFNSIVPDFTDTVNRQTISFVPSGYNMLLTYKNADDAEKQMYSLYTSDGSTWGWYAAAVSSTGTDNSYRDVVYEEGLNISAVDQDYFVIQKAGFSHTMQFTAFTPSTNELDFTDESGNTLTVTANNSAIYSGQADLIVDGNTYKVAIVSNSTSGSSQKLINVDLNGDGYIAGTATGGYSSVGTLGTSYSYLVPKLVTSGQGGLYFYNGNQSGTLTGIAWSYPRLGFGGIRLVNNSATVTVSYYSAGTTPAWTNFTTAITPNTTGNVAGQTYALASTADSGAYVDIYVNITNTSGVLTYNVALGTTNANMQTAKGFVLVEEAQEGGTTHNWLYFPVAWDSTNSRTYVNTPVSDDALFITSAANILGTSTQYRMMDTYGSLVDWAASALGGSATVKYPDVFTYGNVYVLGPTGTISTSGVVGATTADKLLPITGDIVKLDTEVSASDKTSNDLIIVGGPCINTLAADVLGKTYPACGASSGMTSNTGLIQLFVDKYATGKSALLIAGWEAAQTDLASRLVQNGLPFTSDAQKAGTKLTVTGTVSSPAYS